MSVQTLKAVVTGLYIQHLKGHTNDSSTAVREREVHVR